MIQTVCKKSPYISPEVETMELRMEPMRGFCSDTPPIRDDDEIPD